MEQCKPTTTQMNVKEKSCKEDGARKTTKLQYQFQIIQYFKIKFFALREAQQEGELKLLYCNIDEQPTDIFTKPLPKTQLRLEAFYSFNERFEKIRSKRFKKVVKGITGNQYSDMIDDLVEEVSKSKLEIYQGNLVTMNLRNIQRELLLEKPKWSRKRTTEVHACPEVENTEATVRQCKSGHDEHGVHVDESSGPHELRKSTRLRKPVNYTVDYLEIDDGEVLGREMVALASKTMNNLKWEILHFRASPGIILKGEMDFSSMERKGELSNDYLERGGGFCLDESDTGMDQGTAHSPPTTVDGETGDLLEDVEHDTELLNEVRDGGRTRASDTELNADNVVAAHADCHLRSRRGGQLLAQEV
uniref:Uncharacterized protein n=1 Tax=Salix viminalis TaxID=40686 RepID=A0A6N2LFV9_SALVM